jgi:ABC-type bacteriocin/lantibiotic exporter with double-glycine peptidase domain
MVCRWLSFRCTDQSSTSVLGLVQTSKQLGFIAKAVKAQTDKLSEIAFPAIGRSFLPLLQ